MSKKRTKKAGAAKGSAVEGSEASAGDSSLKVGLDWFKSILIAIALAMVIRWFVAEPFKIPSSSMEPTFHGDERMFRGDRIFVNKHAYGVRYPFNGFRIPFTRKTIWYADQWLWTGGTPERWDIVVFKSVEPGVPHDTLVKRVAGLPGERVRILGGKLYINGEPVALPDDMPEVFYTQAALSNGYGLIRDDAHGLVPEGHVFLLGDNSAHSRDARWFGWVPIDHLLGRVTSIWFPVSRWRDFTGFTSTWWWIGMWLLAGMYVLVRLFVGRSVGVYGDGLGGLVNRGEHVFVRFALGLPVPFTHRRLGRWGELRRGDVVLYRPPAAADKMPDLLLGIVAGLPMERVYLEAGRVHADGNRVSDPPVFDAVQFDGNGRRGKFGVSRSKEYTRVPEDHFFVLADGRGDLPDSRVLGWVARDRIVGPARYVWWPLTRWRRVNPERPVG